MALHDFPRNSWYVLAWSHEISAEGTLDRTVLGNRLVAYRKSDGTAVVLRNRCPHRSAPLSAGRREGDAIRCGYHGMLFGGDGRCLAIPGQDKIPPNADVQAFPVAERYGWIWVWPGDPALADAALIPTLSRSDETRWKWRTGYIGYNAGAELLHDNLLDFSHLEFVHEKTLGGDANWADKPEVRKTADGFRIERWMPDVAPAPFLNEVVSPGERHDILNLYDFHVPGVLVIDTPVQAAGTGPREKVAEAAAIHNLSYQAVTPATDTSSHYFFGVAIPNVAPDFVLDVIMAGTLRAFEEDRLMIERQQALLSAEPDEPISRVALAADGPLVQMRAMLRKLAAAERQTEPS